MITQVCGVQTFSWNPRRLRRLSRLGLSVGPRENNFGDLLGPSVVRAQVEDRQLQASRDGDSDGKLPRLITVGSVLHFARDNDVVWGSGVNGKIARDMHKFSKLDVRALRGPLSRDWLWQNHRIESPEIYGDPALLLAKQLRQDSPRSPDRALLVIPNLNDWTKYRKHPSVISPRRAASEVTQAIANSEYLVTSSLHALIFAELLRVPVRLIAASEEPLFKYEDYFLGTGRNLPQIHETVEAAELSLRIEESSPSLFETWTPDPLIRAFPEDLWVTEY